MHAALGEVLADKFCGGAPGDDVNEICLLLAALGLEVPVHSKREGCHGGATSGAAQLGVPGETTHGMKLPLYGKAVHCIII